jgi:hypothetical protein
MKEKLNLKNLIELSVGALKGAAVGTLIYHGANQLVEYRNRVQVQENVVLLKNIISKNSYVDTIALRDENGNAFCSGTLLRTESIKTANDRFVLTDKHCRLLDPKIELKILTNPYDLQGDIKHNDSAVLITVKELRKNGIDISNYTFTKDGKDIYFQGTVVKVDSKNPFCDKDSIDFKNVENNGIRVHNTDRNTKPIEKTQRPGNSGSLITQNSTNKKDEKCIVGLVEGMDFDRYVDMRNANAEVIKTPRIFAPNNNEFKSITIPNSSIKTIVKESE